MKPENKEKKPHPWSDAIAYEFETARRKEEIYKETVKWMETDNQVQEYFKQFNPDSLAFSIKSYAWQKADWIVKKEMTEWVLEIDILKYKNEAEKCLSNIQQKKLFDKQCQWRAELFTHPSIETTHDFSYWEYNVLNCPFIDPISREDVELYIEFLQIHLDEDLPFLASWQDYNTYNSRHPTVNKVLNVKDKNNDENMADLGDDEDDDENLFPPWYAFWNTRRGDGGYLVLPDLRQEKEWFYGKLAQQEQFGITAEQFKANPPDTRPSLNLHGKNNLISFINSFEKDSKEVMNAFLTNEKLSDEDPGENAFEVAEAWEDLSDCNEPFDIAEGISDWKEALIATARQWRNTKVIRLLPIVFDEYLFRMQCGIEHPYDTANAASYRKMADHFKAKILRGRELNGEPKDLHF